MSPTAALAQTLAQTHNDWVEDRMEEEEEEEWDQWNTEPRAQAARELARRLSGLPQRVPVPVVLQLALVLSQEDAKCHALKIASDEQRIAEESRMDPNWGGSWSLGFENLFPTSVAFLSEWATAAHFPLAWEDSASREAMLEEISRWGVGRRRAFAQLGIKWLVELAMTAQPRNLGFVQSLGNALCIG